jgi:hypothetical protein
MRIKVYSGQGSRRMFPIILLSEGCIILLAADQDPKVFTAQDN